MEHEITKKFRPGVSVEYSPELTEILQNQKELKAFMKKAKQDLKKMNDKKMMKEVRYIGVEFEPNRIQRCQDEVNEALAAGFQPIKDIPTAKGLVMVLGLWG